LKVIRGDHEHPIQTVKERFMSVHRTPQCIAAHANTPKIAYGLTGQPMDDAGFTYLMNQHYISKAAPLERYCNHCGRTTSDSDHFLKCSRSNLTTRHNEVVKGFRHLIDKKRHPLPVSAENGNIPPSGLLPDLVFTVDGKDVALDVVFSG